MGEYDVHSFMENLCFSEAPTCPSCGAPRSKYRRNGSYPRHFVCYADGAVCSHTITIRSARCSSCMKSHAMLVSVIIPWSSYSLGFTISLFYARMTRKFPSALSLCEHFDISESTYYRLRKRFALDSKELLAALKLSVIQPAFNGAFPDMSKKDYYVRIAAKPLKLPDGRGARYSPGTYACWESDYRKGGFDALIPKERAGRGHSRKLDSDATAKIYELHERYPKLSAAGIRNRMTAGGLINAADVSVTTFQRFIKKNNLKGASAPGQEDRRAFEEGFSTGMFQAGTLYGPYISENGSSGRTYCIRILDDRSRLIVGGKFFYQDNSVNFQEVLYDAVATYGIPGKLCADNGSPYKNGQLSLICGRLGAVLIHTPVRDGASKGKAERNFRAPRPKFLNAIDPSGLKGIAGSNPMLADYIRSHNTPAHSATGMTPYSRYMEDLSHIRMPKSRERLGGCFLHRVKRRARNDSTVMIDKKLYDVPMGFIRSTVEVRCRPGEPGSAFMLDNGRRCPVRPAGKAANSKIKRDNGYRVRYGGAS